MPGISCSVHDPADQETVRKWEQGLQLMQHFHGVIVEQFREPGFEIACIHHPAVCAEPRILVTERYVLTCYGNIYDDDAASLPETDGPCRGLLDRYDRDGVAGLQDLNGRYDIAVWDRRDRLLHFVGDRFGSNRHYLLRRASALHLACEVKALAPFLDHVEIDPAGLASTLLFGYHVGDLTVLRHVKCLPHARRLSYRAADDNLRVDRYWDFPYGESEPWPFSETDLSAQLHDHLTTALARQMRGVHKVLLPISGGLDSRALAGLLRQSRFAGDVLTYSYGQSTSRDVRYGRAIARKLGYRHVAIPTPRDFVTRCIEEEAWRGDAEWPATLNWSTSAHQHPALGNVGDCTHLSGMFGDMVLGADRFGYRARLGDSPQPLSTLLDTYFACNEDYAPPAAIRALFTEDMQRPAFDGLSAVVTDTLVRLQHLPPYFALMRSEFINRQRRQTASITQRLDSYRNAITPFLDRDLVDFSTRIPLDQLHRKSLYKKMIARHLPAVAGVPYGGSGLPLCESPFRAAIEWRRARLLQGFPRLRTVLNRRNASFDFAAAVCHEAAFFRTRLSDLRQLAPPLGHDRVVARMKGLVTGRIAHPDGACTLLPTAMFLRMLRSKI